MGFLEPSPPPFDLEEWKAKPHLSRLKPLVQDWGGNGFGSPTFVYLALRAQAGRLLRRGAVGDLADARARLALRFRRLVDPADRLREVRGLAAALGDPRARRRLDAAQLPLQPADRRRSLLAAARDRPAAALAGPGAVDQGDDAHLARRRRCTRACWRRGVFLLAASGVDRVRRLRGQAAAGGDRGAARAPRPARAARQGLVPRRPARDLRARCSSSGSSRVEHWVVAWQFVFLFIWWGAASSKLNSHFPFVVSTMMSNAPVDRRGRSSARLWRDYPEDMRPSRLAAGIAHLGTVQEFLWPALLVFQDNPTIRTIAIVGMILFHVNITSMFPLAVPLEWNLFMIFGILFLFGHYGDVPLSTLDDPLLIAVLAVLVRRCCRCSAGTCARTRSRSCPRCATTRATGRPARGCSARGAGRRRSSTRTSRRPRANDRRAGRRTSTTARPPHYLLNKGLAFRAMHSHGRALNALLPHAAGDVEATTCARAS